MRSARHTEVRRVIDTADLTAVAAKRVKALSGGQRRRVVLAQSLLGRPDLLILDEPTAGLDPEQRARLRDTLSRAGQASTVVISTHQTDDVAALCERVVVLDKGHVLYDGLGPGPDRPSGRAGMAVRRGTPRRPAHLADRQWQVAKRRRPTRRRTRPSRPLSRTPTCCWSANPHSTPRSRPCHERHRHRPAERRTVATLRELALVDAKRFARHPLFIFGVVANFALIYVAAVDRAPAPLLSRSRRRSSWASSAWWSPTG